MLSQLLHQSSTATRVTPLKSASDCSYHAAPYSIPYTRTVGDAGCFIDPFLSSGVHLALTGALAAATTISASIRCDVDEETAGWKIINPHLQDFFGFGSTARQQFVRYQQGRTARPIGAEQRVWNAPLGVLVLVHDGSQFGVEWLAAFRAQLSS